MSAARRLTTPQDAALAKALLDAIEAKHLLADLLAKYDTPCDCSTTDRAAASLSPRAVVRSPLFDELLGLAVFAVCLLIAGLWAFGVIDH